MTSPCPCRRRGSRGPPTPTVSGNLFIAPALYAFCSSRSRDPDRRWPPARGSSRNGCVEFGLWSSSPPANSPLTSGVPGVAMKGTVGVRGLGIGREVMIERDVLLKDDDDMPDRRQLLVSIPPTPPPPRSSLSARALVARTAMGAATDARSAPLNNKLIAWRADPAAAAVSSRPPSTRALVPGARMLFRRGCRVCNGELNNRYQQPQDFIMTTLCAALQFSARASIRVRDGVHAPGGRSLGSHCLFMKHRLHSADVESFKGCWRASTAAGVGIDLAHTRCSDDSGAGHRSALRCRAGRAAAGRAAADSATYRCPGDDQGAWLGRRRNSRPRRI